MASNTNTKDEHSEQSNTIGGLAEDDFDWGKLLDLDDEALNNAISDKQGLGSLEAFAAKVTQDQTFNTADAIDFDREVANLQPSDNWETLTTTEPDFADEEESWTELLGAEPSLDWENPSGELIVKSTDLDMEKPLDSNDWEQVTAQSSNDQDWLEATAEVNTEFKMAWQENATKVPDSTDKPSSRLESNTDGSGVLPPLPNLPPKSRSKSPKKSPDQSASSPKKPIDTSDWFEEFNGEELNTPNQPNSTYDFDKLADEICDDGNVSWSNSLGVAKNPRPTPPPPAPATPQTGAYSWMQYQENNQPEVVVVGLEDNIEPTAIWQQPAADEAEMDDKVPSGFALKIPELPKFPKLEIPNLWEIWQKVKIPVVAIGAIAGLYGIFSIPFIQKSAIELGLKLQIVKDASGKDLSNSNFKEAKLERVNFAKANFKNANLVKASLNGANLNGTILIGADLTGANLRGVDLKNSKIELAGKRPTKLDQRFLLMWKIVNEPLAGRNLTGLNLDGFYLNSVVLKQANLTNAQLAWVNLTKADLSDAQLVGANLKGTNLRGANLRGANFISATWGDQAPKTDETTICPNGSKGVCKF
jgi:Pentapeptide repeats (8 copies)